MERRSGWSAAIIDGGQAEELEERLARGEMAMDLDAILVGPDGESESTLMYACRRKDAAGERMVALLLAHGADPDKGFFDESDEPPWLEGWMEEFKDDLHEPSLALVAAKQLAVKSREDGMTSAALGHALRAWASTPNAPAEEGAELVLAGAGVNSTGDESGGKTALILACERGLVAQVRLLLSRGANPGQSSNAGPTRTPLYHAHMGKLSPDLVSSASDHRMVIHMLKSKGQRLSADDEAWFHRTEAKDSTTVTSRQRTSSEVEGVSAAPPAQRQRVEPAVMPVPRDDSSDVAGSGGCGAIAEPREMVEPAVVPARRDGSNNAVSRGGWGAITEPREPWEAFEGVLFKRLPNDGWDCLVCAQCKPMTGKGAFVTHIEGKRHHQVTVGLGGGGILPPFKRCVPPDRPMRKLTERMYHKMMKRQDKLLEQSSYEARVNRTAAVDNDGHSAEAAAAMGGRETQEYWKKQQKRLAQSELLKRDALENHIKKTDAEKMRITRRVGLLEDNLRHYEAKRRECREQSATIAKQQDSIDDLKKKLARAQSEATQQQSSIEELSGRLRSMTIEGAHERAELCKLTSELQGKDDLIQRQNKYLTVANNALMAEIARGQQRELEHVSDNLSQVSIAGGSDAETRARIMQLEHELGQARSSKKTQTDRLRQATDRLTREESDHQVTQGKLDRLNRDHGKLKNNLKANVADRLSAEKQRNDAMKDNQKLKQELKDSKLLQSDLEQERHQRQVAEEELDRLRREGHAKDYAEALRTATSTIADVLGEEDGPEAKREVRDQLLGSMPGTGSAAARGLINFAELLQVMCCYETASMMIKETSDYQRHIQEVQDAAKKAMGQNDHWMLPCQRIGTVDAEAVYRSLDRRPGRRFNANQKRQILDELEHAGSGSELVRNPDYSRNALGEEEFIEMPFDPPLDTWDNGKVTVDTEHPALRRIKKEYGEGARDAVIKCFKEQLEHNSSGGYADSKIIDPGTGKEMLPGKIVERMAVWTPGYMEVECFSSPEQLACPDSAAKQFFHVANTSREINTALRHHGLVDDLGAEAKIYLKRKPLDNAPSTMVDARDLLRRGDTLGDKIDVGVDVSNGKLHHFVLVAEPR